MVERAKPGGDPKAAIHSGLESALGSHPCVALSSYQASPVYGSFSNQKRQNHPFWKKTALNPGGLGGAEPPIMAMTVSFLTGAGTDLPAFGSRVPGGDAGDCKSGSSGRALGTDRPRWR